VKTDSEFFAYASFLCHIASVTYLVQWHYYRYTVYLEHS
jgi:hypothetical protein